MNLRNWFWIALASTVIVRIILAALIPMTGDELYYYFWSLHPDYGYYDHPPMVAWWVSAMRKLGTHPMVLRLPAIFASWLVAALVYRVLLKLKGERVARLGVLVVVLHPLLSLPVLLATDLPLIVFSLLSVFWFWQGYEEGRLGRYWLAGLALGLAFLSKYFAIFTGVSFLLFALLSKRKRWAFKGILIVVLAMLPFLALHLHWNYAHCWANLVFNFSTRNMGEMFEPVKTLGLFLLYQIYLITPFVICEWVRSGEWRSRWRQWRSEPLLLFALAWMVPFAAFFLTALKFGQGIHWMFGYYPAFFMLVACVVSEARLVILARWMAGFWAAHVVAVAILLVLPLTVFRDWPLHRQMVLFWRGPQVVQAVMAKTGFETNVSVRFAAESYTQAALLTYYSGEEFSVFGRGGKFGRQDDLVTHYRHHDGSDFVIFLRHAPDFRFYKKFFIAIDVRHFEIEGETFFVVHGHKFKFEKYRKKILKEIDKTYYAIPDWLPVGACYFKDRYF